VTTVQAAAVSHGMSLLWLLQVDHYSWTLRRESGERCVDVSAAWLLAPHCCKTAFRHVAHLPVCAEKQELVVGFDEHLAHKGFAQHWR
jgi:hypothetical protein